MQSIKIVFVTVLLALFSASCPARSEGDTLRVLFVGNSYTYFENLPQVVSVLSDRTNMKLVTGKITAGGAKLSEHWRGARGLSTKETIKNGNYDIVVLQEWSLGTINEKDSAMKYLELFSDYSRAIGAEPCFFLTWAREKTPQQQEEISRVYRDAALKFDAKVVPAGEAWAIARERRPDFRLYNPDGTHPSEFGTYLTATVFVAAITGELPAELPNVISIRDQAGEEAILMMISKDDAGFCREVAAETTGIR